MTELKNPAFNAFLEMIGCELTFAQVSICRNDQCFEVRHVVDRNKPRELLQLVRESDLRKTVQFTSTGAFRPLKSAPNLRNGWIFEAADPSKLEFALNTLYPGAIADWFAKGFRDARPTDYREFTDRQTGMYRITATLTDEQLKPVITAGCHKSVCLKQRLWTGAGLATDPVEEKSLIPCLEPCAVFLEFARKAARLNQATIKGENLASRAAVEPDPDAREADFESPGNPRRMLLAMEKNRAS